MPLPVTNLRKIQADFMDILLMFYQLIPHELQQIGAAIAQLR